MRLLCWKSEDLGIPRLNKAEDRVMICGGPGMLKHLKHVFENYSLSFTTFSGRSLPQYFL